MTEVKQGPRPCMGAYSALPSAVVRADAVPLASRGFSAWTAATLTSSNSTRDMLKLACTHKPLRPAGDMTCRQSR